MYDVIQEAKENVQGYQLTGNVGGVPFSHKNIIGNFTVSNKAANPSTFNLGNVGIGQLSCTIVGLNIGRNSWKGKYIEATVTIGQEEIPLPSKRYKIDTAEHTNGLVKITAYDDMMKFDTPAAVQAGNSGSAYDFLVLACEECGVEFGMTEADVRAFPNGILPLSLEEMGDIETWRDVIYWVAVTLCAFATINRQGKLELRRFHSTTDDTIPANIRYDGALYDDEIVTYTGIYVNVSAEETAHYYAADPDDGYTLSIGTNPFLQGSEIYREQMAQNIIGGLSEIEYISGRIEVPFAFQYDLGDVLLFPGGSGSSTNKFCIMAFEYIYNGKCRLTGIPGDKKSSSKTDKNLQGLLANTSKNETTSYETKNTGKINIGDGETENIVSLRIASNTNTKAMIHVEVNLQSQANEPTAEIEAEENVINLSDIWAGICETAVIGRVSYVINSIEDDLHPVETYIDGKHVLHLMYILPLQQGLIANFNVYLKATGGTIKIDRGDVWTYALGVGLVGDGKWDGVLRCEEDAEDITLINITIDAATETIDVTLITPEPITISETAGEITPEQTTVEAAGEQLTITLRSYSFPRITQEGNQRITEDGNRRFTEGD